MTPREAAAALRAAERRAALERGVTGTVPVEEFMQEQPELVNEPEQIIEEPAAVFEVPAAAMAIPEGPELYHRQASFNLGHPRVMIVGCGGVGVWAALALALGGAKALELYDGDTLSLHNLNRFPLPASKVGELKSVALASWLRSLRPECKIRAHGMLDPTLEPPAVCDWVVCSTDSLKSRKMAREVAASMITRQGNSPYYLELGADGERWSLTAEPPEFSTELEEQAGYATVPVHVGPCMMAGAAAAYYVLHGQTPLETLQGDWAMEQGRIASHLALRSYSEEDAPVPTISSGITAAYNENFVMWQNMAERIEVNDPRHTMRINNITVPDIPEAEVAAAFDPARHGRPTADRERGTLTVEEVAHAFDEIRRGEDEQT